MKSVSSFAHSLLLAVATSFVAPLLLLAITCSGFQLWTYLPWIGGLGATVNQCIADFLTIFGNGSMGQGIFTISIVCAVVGALFDTYAFYHFPTHRNQ
jgi:membrane-bound metal-dependent hydrolase YbcI (DUF457 family)